MGTSEKNQPVCSCSYSGSLKVDWPFTQLSTSSCLSWPYKRCILLERCNGPDVLRAMLLMWNPFCNIPEPRKRFHKTSLIDLDNLNVSNVSPKICSLLTQDCSKTYKKQRTKMSILIKKNFQLKTLVSRLLIVPLAQCAMHITIQLSIGQKNTEPQYIIHALA